MQKLNNSILYTVFALLCFTFCNGQTKTKPQNKIVIKPLSFTSKKTKLTKTQGSDEFQVVHCSLQDKHGNIWFGTSKEGVYKYDGKTFTQFTEKDGLCSNLIVEIFEDKFGDIWLGSREAISRYDGKKFTTTPIPSSVISNLLFNNSIDNTSFHKNELWSMMQDKKGIIWLGTTDGIYCYDGKSFTRFLDNKNILNTSRVQLKWSQCIYEDTSGNIWFGSWVYGNEGICRYDGKSITQFKPYGEGWIRTILEDKNGNLLIATRHNGVCSFDGKEFTNFTEKAGIQNSSINLAIKDKAGNIWIGTELGSGELNEDGGLWRYDGKFFTRFTRKDGLCHNGVFSILEDTVGNIWLGSRNTELCRFDGKIFTRFSE